MGASTSGAAFPDGVVRACARQGARTRDGAEEKIVVMGAWMMERTGPCQREHGTGRRSCEQPRASACKDQDAVTVARTAALQALHRGDGAGARAVATCENALAQVLVERRHGRPRGRALLARAITAVRNSDTVEDDNNAHQLRQVYIQRFSF
jgi:hypothetical protein